MRITAADEVTMLTDPNKFRRDVDRLSHVVDGTSGASCLWHAAKLGRFLVLREGDAAAGLDGPNPICTVIAGTGEDDSDSKALLFIGERTEELIDWEVG